MGKQKKDSMKILKIILFILMFGILLYFALAEAFLPPEKAVSIENCRILDSQWERVFPDGSRELVEVPGKCEAYRREAVIIETTLPDDIDDGYSICLRSSQQDMEIYVDGMLRQRYTTKDSRPFGRNSMSAYVFAGISEADCGKKLRIISISDSMYTGQLNEVYIGNPSAILNFFIQKYGFITLVDMIILLLSVIVIAASAVLRWIFHKDVALNYLGWGVFWVAMWMLAESKLRQFLLPNNSVFGSVAFFSVMVIPIPFYIYMDSMQEHRYQRCYKIMSSVSMVLFAACTILQLGNIADFIDTLLVMNTILGFAFAVGLITMLLDWKKKKLKEYQLIAFGFAGVIITGSVEIIWVYLNINHNRGIMICVGLLFLLTMASIKTAKTIMKKEQETQVAAQLGKSKADFLANMSHEIRTPINTVIGMNEMILRENGSREVREYAQNIKRASNMLLALIDDVLDFSKIEAGRMEVVETEYDLNLLLKDVVQVLSSKAEEKGLYIEVYIDDTLPAVLSGDEIRIKQVLNNLVTNAVKYTSKGKIIFRVSGRMLDEQQVELTMDIEDTGIGIRQEDMSKLFESFTRLEQEKNRSIQGTGLGLSITKRLIDLMHGKLEVKSVYGKGSVFSVVLPQKILGNMSLAETKENVEAESKKTDSMLTTREAEALYAPSASVLVVDDNDMNLEVFKALLKRTGIKVDTAVSGKECLVKTRCRKYDLIFMDHMMPQMDGIQAFHRLREEQQNPNRETKVISLTANAIAGSREFYLGEGFDDYLSKPIVADKLEKMLCIHLPEHVMEKRPEDEMEGFENEKQKSTETQENAKIKEDIHTSGEEVAKMIDKDSAMIYCCNSDEMYYEMLKVYLTQAQKYVEKLPLCYEQRDWENYAIMVHAIKSTSLTIGANQLSEKAKVQEMEAKAKNEAFLLANWDEFFAYYLSVLEQGKEMIL